MFTRNQFRDHHGAIRTIRPAACEQIDRPAAALVSDLLKIPLTHWAGHGWSRLQRLRVHGLAGDGVKDGTVHEATADLGHKAVVSPVSHHDFHANVQHLLGLGAKRRTQDHNGREPSLLDSYAGWVVSEIFGRASGFSEGGESA